jgi:hypothetical protein
LAPVALLANEGAKKGPPKPAPPVRSGRLFAIANSGKPGTLDPIILACAREHLAPLGLREGTVVKLERSGTLAVVSAPTAVYEGNFNACLRQGLSRVSHSALPAAVVIKVIK